MYRKNANIHEGDFSMLKIILEYSSHNVKSTFFEVSDLVKSWRRVDTDTALYLFVNGIEFIVVRELYSRSSFSTRVQPSHNTIPHRIYWSQMRV